ncbi:hypothetical protein [Streptomyces sp. NEAU-YJ-81]|uniref:hypothetical protein n=1 Tax=Streptomyces sp. NEAU-YJ-81 TaxID=2820288 RepID=UPI001ABD2B1F|nr:hypothetical protein [Streptomyces sp. NEAU-YJ-81]MBO3674888.1 hypothetical protein [Streptomyces sp. NEAU-YJ-81]
MLRILLIFRLMHGIQLAVTVPGIAGHLPHRPGVAAADRGGGRIRVVRRAHQP